MTVQEKNARRKLSVLQLAVELKNISKTCNIVGYSRTQFYEIRRKYQLLGMKGLFDQAPGVKQRHPLKIAEDKERRILEVALEYPAYGPRRLEGVLRLEGMLVSFGTIYNVLCRENLNTRLKRLLRLEEQYEGAVHVLNEEQIKVLQTLRLDTEGRHIEASHSGEVLNQDTFYLGQLKGVGRIYMQVVVDCYCSFAFAKLYTSKIAETACDLLNSCVLPFYESLGIAVNSVLTDNGSEYCGRKGYHPYELFLLLEGMRHRRTRVRAPWTNGFVERFNRTLLEEFVQVEGRKGKWITLEDIQRDLDTFLRFYNFQRPHQGYRLNGRKPIEGLIAGRNTKCLPLAA